MGWVRFSIVRAVAFGLCLIASAAVLGLSAYQSTLFMDGKYDKPFLITALTVSVVSVLASAALAFKYSFETHIGCIAILCILWLSLASYVTDRIGYVQCESLDGQLRPTSNGKGYNEVSWCRELKGIMGFSWFNFGLMIIAIVSWIRLQEHEEEEGLGPETGSEREPYRAAEAGNFAQRQAMGAFGANGVGMMNGGITGGGYGYGVPGQQVFTGQPGSNVIYQQPGHNVVLQNGVVRQVPVGAPI